MNQTSLFLALALTFAGCRAHAPASTQGPGLNGQREANLRKAAAEQLHCTPDELTVRFIESIERNVHVYRAEGCGGRYEALLACMMGQCSWGETPDKRAAFDLQCPQDQLTRTYLGQWTFGVSGCGRTITYLYVDGRLVANNSATGVAPPPRKAEGKGGSDI